MEPKWADLESDAEEHHEKNDELEIKAEVLDKMSPMEVPINFVQYL
jgi:hypothetical protein